MKPLLLVIGLALAMTTAATAQTGQFHAANGVIVTPVAGGFSVPDGGGYGARGMWCAAADYAKNVLGAGVISRVYIAQPRRTSRGPVVFSVEPYSGAQQQVLITGLSLRHAGANLNLGHAIGFCADAEGRSR